MCLTQVQSWSWWMRSQALWQLGTATLISSLLVWMPLTSIVRSRKVRLTEKIHWALSHCYIHVPMGLKDVSHSNTHWYEATGSYMKFSFACCLLLNCMTEQLMRPEHTSLLSIVLYQTLSVCSVFAATPLSVWDKHFKIRNLSASYSIVYRRKHLAT